MYEEQTFDVILTRLLARVKDTLDKREGSIIYDALAPAAVELANCYTALDTILEESFADTASREYLIRRCKERGIIPEEATYAVMEGRFNINIPIGSRFNLGSYNYTATEKISDGVYKMLCDTAGEAPNSVLGDLTPIEYITGLITASLTACLTAGEEAEATETLRSRYFSSFSNLPYGGNVADYMEKVHAVSGVGACKVYPAWNGGGTVKVLIMSSDYYAAGSTLINTVQTLLDPTVNNGKGEGLAPIGHHVTVASFQTCIVHVWVGLQYRDGVTFADVKQSIYDVVNAYYKSLNKDIENNDITVRHSKVMALILDVAGILDVKTLWLNSEGYAGNVGVVDGVIVTLDSITEVTS